MWTYKTKILFICYKLFTSWLPISQRASFAKKWRTFFAKRIIKNCGENVNIESGAVFTPELSIGNNSGIGIDCEVYGPVTIGNDVMMGPEVVIYTSNHQHSISSEPFWKQGSSTLEVTIGNNVWIGRRAMFMAGSSVGDNVVVAAGAVVTKQFGDGVIIGGVPAKIIGRIEKEEV